MKPGDFFIGAMEFFSILLPGAVLAYLLAPWASWLFGPLMRGPLGEAERWLAFAVAAYFLGHLLHHAAPFLDRWYDQRYVARKRRFGDETLYREAKKLAAQDLGGVPEDVSVFQWAGSYVRLHSAAAGAEIERAGGESKFFRSLCLVGAIAALVFMFKGHIVGMAAAAALTAFSYWRFCDRRWQSTQRTYEYFVLLRRHPGTAPH